jgi:multimeric flavodoxin WrbA
MKKKSKIKITSIISSPHKEGNSATLARKAMISAREAGASTNEIYLPDYEIDFCHGCMKCLEKDGCILYDDLNLLRDELLESDGLIFSSPTYGLNPNAMMMNFLQRIGIYTAYRSALGGKFVAGISTAGGVGAKKVAKYLTESADGLFRYGKKVGYLGATGGKEELDKYYPKAEQLGKDLVEAIKKKKKYPFQNFMMKIISKLFLNRVMKENLEENKEGSMKGVYKYLKSNQII